ncbi:Ras family protein [Onchocerca flexuosa]|uniref:Ras family protein n=1 Tax=Onchocerca flexuosa TaxID=387005 RepID=A0A238BX93_9BILA|nr:Ras family protein [Onchocerca flexuosa]
MEWDEETSVQKIIKIVVCGDGASGKTSLCVRFAQDNFGGQYQQVLNFSMFFDIIECPTIFRGIILSDYIWDIGGQSIASPMLEKYIKDAHGAVVVYDVTNSSSFENLEDWINIIKQVTEAQEKPVVLMLVGNKTDLEHRRVVRIERHTKFALQYGMSSYYVSAKTGDSVTLMFRKTAAEILGIPLEQSDTEGDIIVVKASVATRTEAESKALQQQLRADQSRNTTVCSMM